ncbi:MAG: LA_2444/LA_4059 family outer membrane protein [Leptospira sp.]|nr:LA_2444/LA_4059 family outer membrane protein [Leptospira sp.]
MIFYGFPQTKLFAEEKPDSPKSKNNFELTLKRQRYEYIPYEYTSYGPMQQANYSSFSQTTDDLKRNTKNIIPLNLSYYNYDKNFRIEASYFKIKLSDAEFTSKQAGIDYYNSAHYYSEAKRPVLPLVRSEFELNVFKIFIPGENLEVQIGGGIRNINKTSTNTRIDDSFYSNINTYGPQLVSKIQWRFIENWSLALGADVFYTAGKQEFRHNSLNGPYSVTVAADVNRSVGVFRGYEADVGISYSISENCRLSFGFNQISSYFAYSAYSGYLGSKNPAKNPYNITYSASGSYPDFPRRVGGYEYLRGYYFGLTIGF